MGTTTRVTATWQVVAVAPVEIPPNGWGIPSKIPAGWRSFVYDKQPSFFKGHWLAANGVTVPAEVLRVVKKTTTEVIHTTEEEETLQWIPSGMFGGDFKVVQQDEGDKT